MIQLQRRSWPASTLHLTRIFNREASPWLIFQPLFIDRLAGAFADTEGAVLEFGQGAIDLAEKLPIFFHQTERELLLVIVGAHVGHVDWQIGKVAAAAGVQGFMFHRAHVAEDFATLGAKQFTKMFQIARRKTGRVLARLAVVRRRRGRFLYNWFGGATRRSGSRR